MDLDSKEREWVSINNKDIKQYKVYVHVNKINGKLYIGQTCKTLKSRFGRNGKNYKNSNYFYNSIKKHGWNNFKHILLFDNLSGEEANILEKELIHKYNTTNKTCGYNLDTGGKNGRTHSKETIEKLRKGKLGKNNPNYMKKLSTETCRRMSESRTGDKHYLYGKHHTVETKQKISESKQGVKIISDYVFTEQHKFNLSESHKNKILSDETKSKMSESKKGHIVSKETREKISNAKSRNVFQFSKDNILINTFKSSIDAERKTNIRNQNILKCCKGERKTAGGYIWKYNCELGEVYD